MTDYNGAEPADPGLVTAEDWLAEAQARYHKANQAYSSPEIQFAAAQAAALIALALQGRGA